MEGAMLKNIIFADKPENEELKGRLKAARSKLSEQQTLYLIPKTEPTRRS